MNQTEEKKVPNFIQYFLPFKQYRYENPLLLPSFRANSLKLNPKYLSSPPLLSIGSREGSSLGWNSRRHEKGTGARARENRFSIRFNFTLTSAQFSLHGYWPFSSASGRRRRADRNEERKREREWRAYFRSAYCRCVSQKRGDNPPSKLLGARINRPGGRSIDRTSDGFDRDRFCSDRFRSEIA